jgi:iron complex outermembrane receptor protein
MVARRAGPGQLKWVQAQSRAGRSLAVACGLLLGSGMASAQLTTAVETGRVLDDSGAEVPEARATDPNRATGVSARPISASAQPPATHDLADLTLEELAKIQITSVSRHTEPLAGAPASIFVITAEDIRRSGATSLAEALRLAPNLQVARQNAAEYAISARGFDNLIANKLLVLVDGRTIYTPLFSGVFWDQQDVLLEDIERIEVISGPGATLWGANAVNGVINVITRRARDTQGALVSIGAGNREQGAAFRYGGALGEHVRYRAYGKASHLENTQLVLRDNRLWVQGGFRIDGDDASDGFTLQGDAYKGRSEDRGSIGPFALGRVELSGANLLGRWTHRLHEGSELRIQSYFDHTKREEAVLFRPEADLFDVELQHAVTFGAHQFVSGGGYRHGSDHVEDAILIGFRPMHRALNWWNVFAQDEIQVGKVELSAGLKLEHNDYTGVEYLPSARVAWKPSDSRLVWGAISRAVRAPARFDRDVYDTLVPGNTLGGPNFQAEVANVFELGYRGRPTRSLTCSVTAFLQQWDKLRSGTTRPLILENKIEGPVYGVEAWAAWQPTRAWRLSGGLTTLRKDLRLKAGSTDPIGPSNPVLGNDPKYQWILRSSISFARKHELDAMVRQVGELPSPRVPAYAAVDMRYAWLPRRKLELSLTGQNLIGGSHPEFGDPGPVRSEFTRAVFVQARWSP